MAKRDSTTMLLDSLEDMEDFTFHDLEEYDFIVDDDTITTAQSISTTTGSISAGNSSTSQQAICHPSDLEKKLGPLTGRPPLQLYLSCDPDTFSEYQVIVRQNIELFEAQQQDVESSAQGRNNPIVLGQVGIRCSHCNCVPPSQRTKGAMYFPSKLSGLYQAAQNLAVMHLMEHCTYIPAHIRENLIRLRDQKSAAGGGKNEWAKRVHALGVYEDNQGLRFACRVNSFVPLHH